jgi:hypothetical protein
VLAAPLPRPIAATLYSRLGDAPAAVIIAIAFAIVVRRRLNASDAAKF